MTSVVKGSIVDHVLQWVTDVGAWAVTSLQATGGGQECCRYVKIRGVISYISMKQVLREVQELLGISSVVEGIHPVLCRAEEEEKPVVVGAAVGLAAASV